MFSPPSAGGGGNHRTSRPRHRKRISALRLSSDSTLPAYTSPQAPWTQPTHHQPQGPQLQNLPDIPFDQPPEYPDSADEGDADNDSDSDAELVPENRLQSSSNSSTRQTQTVLLQHSRPSQSLSPRRTQHRYPHRTTRSSPRKPPLSSHNNSDSYLDTLLERSVHALEMSNTLLASTHSTQSALSSVLRSEDPINDDFETSARTLSSRISHSHSNSAWSDDLDGILKGVQGLLDLEADNTPNNTSSAAADHHATGQTPPISASPHRSSRISSSPAERPHLEHVARAREHFVAPPPRALTIYVDSNDNPDSIPLPSTLGVRGASSSTHDLHSWKISTGTSIPKRAASSTGDLHAWPESDREEISGLPTIDVTRPMLSHTPASEPGPSSAVTNPSVASTASQFLAALADRLPKRRSSLISSFRRTPSRQSTTSTISSTSTILPIPSTSGSCVRSDSLTPKRPEPTQLPRLMTSIDELSSASSSDASSEPTVERTLTSLRKILDEAPKPPPPPPPPRPALLVQATSRPSGASTPDTSHATASVSRLFTKNQHSSSARPRSPTRSALKGTSAANSPNNSAPPTPSPSLLSITVPGLGSGANSSRSRTSSIQGSGSNTPRRIAFAAMPDSYAASKPPSEAGEFERQKNRGRRKRSDKGGSDKKGKGKGREKEEEEGWMSWLLGAAGASRTVLKEEERGGSRWARPQGVGFGGGSMDDWGI